MVIIITINSNKIIINMQKHFKKYVEEINKISFQKQWEYVQKKLISKDILDIKF